LLTACGGPAGAGDDGCADVVGVATAMSSDGTARIDVTVESDDEGWEAYADRWELLVDGEVIAERVLLHPHVDEQPFTRSLSGVQLPVGERIVVRAHHSVGGYCGLEGSIDT
jgi:hypothetical protein